MISLYEDVKKVNKNIKLNKFFIDLFSVFVFLAFQVDYLITYLGVKVLEYAIEANPVTDVFLNMSQKKAIPIRFIVVFAIVYFINLRLKYFLKEENIRTIIILVTILAAILTIVFALHSLWIISFIMNYMKY